MADPIITRRCCTCKRTKPISEFHKSSRAKDGHQGCCKICRKTIQGNFQKTAKGKLIHAKGTAKYHKTEKGKAARKRFCTLYPNHIKARSAVSNAIRDGKLPQLDTLFCHYCPKPAQQYHHWHGYEPQKWLDVVPACIPCHKIHN